MGDYADLLTFARGDERVVGVVLGGSRGKGFATERSDWDVYLVLADGTPRDEVTKALPDLSPEVQVCAVLSLSEFAAHAEVGNAGAWNRCTFAHVTPELDRTDGELAQLCEAKEWLPQEFARAQARTWLDSYVNSYYRALKNARDGSRASSALDSAESVNYLLEFAFSAERRARPYNKYLAWELETHPLERAWWDPTQCIDTFLRVAAGDLRAGTEVFRGVEDTARLAGFSDLLDSWGQSSLATMRQGIG